MLQKTCDNCHKPSFSSCDHDQWICPTCKKDITHIKSVVPERKTKGFICQSCGKTLTLQLSIYEKAYAGKDTCLSCRTNEEEKR